MIGEGPAFALLDKALGYSRAQQTDVYLSAQDLALTRFAGNAIHQNVVHANVTLHVRALEGGSAGLMKGGSAGSLGGGSAGLIKGGSAGSIQGGSAGSIQGGSASLITGNRVGRATTNDLTDAGIRRAVETARQAALLMPADPDLPGLPEPQESQRVASWDEGAASCPPGARARMVRDVCRLGQAEGLNTSGACRTGVQESVVASSRGVRAYHVGTFAGLIVNTMSDTSAGWAKGGSWRFSDIDAEALAREAVVKAVQGRNPEPIEPGPYTVVLEHYAVDDILEALSLYGMGAQAVQEGRSWMNGLVGVKAMHPAVTIWDDGPAANGWPMPFDTEGVPRRRVDIVVEGKVLGPVHNSYTAAKDGVASTGHQAYFVGPPIASNLFMQEGDSSVDQMIASTQRGLYVTRFFYTRLVHNKGCVMTGMTRDGAFLIENGEISRPVKDLRFTQSYVEALAGVEAVGRESKLVLNEVGFATRVPALKLSSFNFTGVTA